MENQENKNIQNLEKQSVAETVTENVEGAKSKILCMTYNIENTPMQKLIKPLGDIVKIFSFLAIAALVSGFLIWNLYLVRLGFYEFNLIQARYIHSGITFLLVFIPSFALFVWIAKHLSMKFQFVKKFFISQIALYFGVILFFYLIILYTLFIFPRISQAWGGAQPRVLSIIASESDIEYLANFGIKMPSSVITQNLCIAYENQEFVIILLENRVLSVKKESFKGFNSLPAKTRDEMAGFCSRLAVGWVLNRAEWIR